MNETKPFYKSKGWVTGLVAALLGAGSVFGLWDLSELFEKASEWALLLGGALGLLFRQHADKRITLTRKEPPKYQKPTDIDGEDEPSARAHFLPKYVSGALAFLLLSVLCSCGTVQRVPTHSEDAVARAVEIAADSQRMAELMTEPPALHTEFLSTYQTRMLSAKALAGARTDNSQVKQMWGRYTSPNAKLGMGMVNHWQKNGPLSVAFAKEWAQLSSDYALMIAELEESRPRRRMALYEMDLTERRRGLGVVTQPLDFLRGK